MNEKEGYLTLRRLLTVLLILFAILCSAIILCPLVGSVKIDLRQVFWGASIEEGNIDSAIFFKTRLPRVFLAVIVGASLSVAGCTFQALLRNPLATPYILGISSGGTFGVVLMILLGLSGEFYGIPTNFFVAFAFSLSAVMFVFYLSKVKGNISTATMLLAGVTVNFFFASLILLLQYLSNPAQSFQMIRWMMGGVDAVDFQPVKIAGLFSLPGIIIILLLSKNLNLISVDVVYAAQVGVDVDKTRKIAFFASSILTAATISVCGPIGFVGLIVPHLLRLMIGSDHRLLMPACAIFGGTFLLICDTIGRSLGGILTLFNLSGIFGSGYSQIEIPVGIITSMCGAPFFIFLLLKRKREGGYLE